VTLASSFLQRSQIIRISKSSYCVSMSAGAPRLEKDLNYRQVSFFYVFLIGLHCKSGQQWLPCIWLSSDLKKQSKPLDAYEVFGHLVPGFLLHSYFAKTKTIHGTLHVHDWLCCEQKAFEGLDMFGEHSTACRCVRRARQSKATRKTTEQ